MEKRNNKYIAIIEKYGVEEVLIQAAEECAELIQACCKMMRVKRGTTPVSAEDARASLVEEMADVAVVQSALIDGVLNQNEQSEMFRTSFQKQERWFDRLLKKEG